MSHACKKHKIAYVLKRFPVLTETFVLNELLALEAQGLDIVIFSLYPSIDPRFHEGISRLIAPIIYVPGSFDLKALFGRNRLARKRFGFCYWKKLLQVLLTRRPVLFWRLMQAAFIAEEAVSLGVTHYHSHFAGKATTAGMFASSLSGIPYSFTGHANDIFDGSVDRRVLAKKIATASLVITVSEFNKRFLGEASKDHKHKIRLIYNGIDFDKFVECSSHVNEIFTLLTVARLVPKKGIDILIEACRILRDKGVEFQSIIVGEGRLRPEIERQINAGGLVSHVMLRPFQGQSEIAVLYRDSDVFVLPCRVGTDGDRDGLPVSIVEALASGVPVVSTPVTGIPEVVKSGENGLLVPEGNAVVLAEALEDLIGRPAFHAALKAGARQSVAGLFDSASTSTALAALLTAGETGNLPAGFRREEG